MRRLSRRSGFALPMTIVVLVVLSAALTSAFLSTTTETTTNTAVRGQSRAYMIAQMALERFLEAPDQLAICPSCDTLRTTPAVQTFPRAVDSDSAYITVTRVRHQSGATTPALYFIQARGVDKRLKLTGRLANVDAERSVGIYAQWNTNTMQTLAAWTSLTGLKKQGSSGLLSGNDACGQRAPIAGTTVPKGDLHYSGHTNWAQGSPPIDTSRTAAQLEADMKIDWNAIINGNAMPADITVPAQPFPNLAWFDADTSRWPIIRVTGSDFSLPNRGRGVLIVEGNFTISGSDMWDGIILVGKKLTSNGNNTVAGATVSGLNVLLPGEPDADPSEFDDATANGNKTYVYDSCKVSRATKSLQRFRVLANTWADNIPSW